MTSVMASILKINVGGHRFETTRSTVNPSSYFRSYFQRWDDGLEKSTELFIDRSGVLFEHVLSTLRNPDYRYPYDNQKEIEN